MNKYVFRGIALLPFLCFIINILMTLIGVGNIFHFEHLSEPHTVIVFLWGTVGTFYAVLYDTIDF